MTGTCPPRPEAEPEQHDEGEERRGGRTAKPDARAAAGGWLAKAPHAAAQKRARISTQVPAVWRGASVEAPVARADLEPWRVLWAQPLLHAKEGQQALPARAVKRG